MKDDHLTRHGSSVTRCTRHTRMTHGRLCSRSHSLRHSRLKIGDTPRFASTYATLSKSLARARDFSGSILNDCNQGLCRIHNKCRLPYNTSVDNLCSFGLPGCCHRPLQFRLRISSKGSAQARAESNPRCIPKRVT